MIQTLIFDWDGTLHNTLRLYGTAFRAAYAWLVEEGYAPARVYSDQEVSVYLGMSAPVMWSTFMPQLPKPVWERASAIIGEHMVRAVYGGEAVLYPGAEKVLGKLKEQGYRLVFLSNCKRAYLKAHREVFQLERWFDGFFCCEDYDFAPKREIFSAVAAQFPGEYAVIGDRASDLEVALVHGLVSVGCAYGFGAPEELTPADEIARSVQEIPDCVARLNRAHM